jgi:hypothetical protein
MTTAFIVGVADSAVEIADKIGDAADMKNISCLMIRMTCNRWSRRALAPKVAARGRAASIAIY